MPLYHKGEVLCGSSGLGAEIYSTEEVRIGTWIDGKPLYRRVYKGLLKTTVNIYGLQVPISDLDTCVAVYGWWEDIDGSKPILPNDQIQFKYTSRVGIYTKMSSYFNPYPGVNGLMTFEYTKITD